MFDLLPVHPGQYIYTFIRTRQGMQLTRMKTVEIILRETDQEITLENKERTKIIAGSEMNTSKQTMIFLTQQEAYDYLNEA